MIDHPLGDTMILFRNSSLSVLFAAFVFVLLAAAQQPTTQALKQLAVLTASDGAAGDWFGYSVAISGNTIVVGAYGATIGSNQAQGAAYVFVEPPNGWGNATQTAKLTASDGASGDRFGTSVSISGDSIVIGAPFANGYAGAGYIFVKPRTGWANATQTAKITASDAAANNFFGTSVSVAAKTVVVGGYGHTGNQGAAYVFIEPNGGWVNTTQNAELTASDDSQDTLGNSVSISANTIVAGAETAAAAYVFVEPATGWVDMTQTARLTASDGSPEDLFGASVTANGKTIVAGAPNKNASYVFVQPSTGWTDMTQTAELTNSHEPTNHLLGFSVALSGGMLTAGTPGNGDSHNSPGIAYEYIEPQSGWKTTSLPNSGMRASDGSVLNDFGGAVSAARSTVVIGAGGATHEQGAAYVFGRQ
jgi:hypothetical protein